MENEFEAIRQQMLLDPMNRSFVEAGQKPLFLCSPKVKVLLIGQAPGEKTMAEGKVFSDKSGEALLKWLGVGKEEFYDSGDFGVLPMDCFYPGKGKSGDLPPREEFAAKYHPLLLPLLPEVRLTLLLGKYSQERYLGDKRKKNLTETVASYQEYLPEYFPLPHPSPLNFRWMGKNPWFEEKNLPALRKEITKALAK